MGDFIEKLRDYSKTIGFNEIDELEIVKPEFREKYITDPAYILIMRKEVNDHFFYILVYKNFAHEEFSLRVYNRYLEQAPRAEYRMKAREFLNFNSLLDSAFDRLYSDVLNYKEEKGMIEEIIKKHGSLMGSDTYQDRVLLALRQVEYKGILVVAELRQLSECGVPVLSALTRFLHKTSSEIIQLMKEGQLKSNLFFTALDKEYNSKLNTNDTSK